MAMLTRVQLRTLDIPCDISCDNVHDHLADGDLPIGQVQLSRLEFGLCHVADQTDLVVVLRPVFPRSRSGNTRERSLDSSTTGVAKRYFQLASPLLTQIRAAAISTAEMQQ